MEVCFVADGIQQFVEEEVRARPRSALELPGEGTTIVDRQGHSLGVGSAPYYRYTVGQRRGLGFASGERLYVLGVRAADNSVVVGSEQELLAAGLRSRKVHWIGRPPAGELVATVRIRSRHDGARAAIRPLPSGGVVVEFEHRQRGVAPGQAAVFYEGSRVLGGCWIEESLD